MYRSLGCWLLSLVLEALIDPLLLNVEIFVDFGTVLLAVGCGALDIQKNLIQNSIFDALISLSKSSHITQTPNASCVK